MERFLVALALLCLAAPVALAQSVSASVGGVIVDDTGAAIPGATVKITNKSNGVAQQVVTGVDGRYRAVALQPAPYDITVELQGFATVQRDVVLFVGTDATIDFKLSVAALSENLTVSAELPLVGVVKSQPSSVVEGEQLLVLPTITRNFLTLSQLLPGSGPTAGTGKFAFTKFGGVADQRNGYTTLVDGGSVDDTDWGSPTINVTQDAVQEFRVFRNHFDAQYGNALTAVVTVVTKSGTNQMRGSGFYFGRDNKLNAKNYFAATKPPFNQTRVGGSLGGPIARNRTHYFAAAEHLDVNATTITSLPATNPFAAQENGVYATPSRDDMVTVRLDHRANSAHALVVRYAYNNQSIGGPHQPDRMVDGLRLTSNSTDDKIRAHSLVAEHNWVLGNNRVNTLRFHLLKDFLATVPNGDGLGITRPSFSWGQNNIAPQYFDRDTETINDSLYVNAGAHDLKFGGELSRVYFPFEAHFNEKGRFAFNTDVSFNADDPRTWPFSLTIQNPGFYDYRTYTVGAFVQDDWRVASRVRMNLGVRYDVDSNMRLNDFFEGLIGDPRFVGIEHFISTNRGNDYDNVQPRIGVTWDLNGTGKLVARCGWGVYVTRNRPWFDATVQDMTIGGAVIIQDPQRLRLFPDVNAVLGGQSLDAYLAQGGVRSVLLLADDFGLPRSYNTSAGIGWQMNNVTALDVDYIHTRGADQLGSTDRNLPASGAISASNPRPVPTFSRVTVVENYSKSTYDALEMFNVPNFVDLTGGNNNMNVTAFLVRTGARDPRQLQWGARYTF